jgi:hypothetical protein
MRIQHGILPLATAVVLSVTVTSLSMLAQGDLSCGPIVEQALADVSANCSSLDRNSACYGFNRVDATFAQVMSDDFFSKPADHAQLVDLSTLTTAPLDPELQQWGVALLNVQANIPGTLPGQAVTFLLIGDASLENAVPPDEALTEVGTPIDVTISTNANIRTAPSTTANVLGGAPAGSTLTADGLSPDGAWLRILYNDLPAWVSRSIVYTDGDLDTLPAIEREARSPMQAFYFRTGIGRPTCQDAPPSALVIQGPQHVTVNLTINGADMTMGSTIVLTQPRPNTLRLSTLDGAARLDDGRLVVPGGFSAEAPQSEDDGGIVGTWGGFHPMTPNDLDQFNDLIDKMPDGLLPYRPDIPSQGEIQQLMNAISGPSNPPPPEATSESTLEPFATEEATPDVVAPIIEGDVYIHIETNPNVIKRGECTTISWNTLNIKEVYFEGQLNIGTNSVQRCPERGQQYGIHVIHLDGTESDHSAGVTVIQPEAPPEPVCDNGICEEGENSESCADDCYSESTDGYYCGNGSCEEGEDTSSCSEDCEDYVS